jgi:hypothetical protein
MPAKSMRKRSIFDPESKHEILNRIDSLTAATKPQWGKMNVNQLLRHLTMGYKMPLGEASETSKGGALKKKLMKFFLLNVPPPKGRAETYPSFNMVRQGIDPQDFEAERKELKNYIEKFTKADSLLEDNPVGGTFSRDDWGRLMYSHCDHHLKQFGT